MKINTVIKTAEKFTIDNSPTILTAVGVMGTVATAVMTGKAAVEAADVLSNEEGDSISKNQRSLTTKERVGFVWKLYLPAAGMGAVTVASIIGANRIGARRAAAMVAAYSLSERAFAEYKDKVAEKLGYTKEQSVRDDVAQDRVRNNPPGQVIVTGGGEVLCYDSISDRYFKSSVERIKRAENEVNAQIIHDNYASLSDFYCAVGLKTTAISEELGWNLDKLLEVKLSAVMSENDLPCIHIEYATVPIRGYHRLQ